MRLRLYESAITSRSVFLRKICGPATFEFCNKIGHNRTWRSFSLRQRLREVAGTVDKEPRAVREKAMRHAPARH